MKTTEFGPIEPEVLYPVQDLRRRLGWGDTAIRAARRGGLKLRYCHGRVFVVGRDVIAYIEEHGADQAPSIRKGTIDG